jgi:hypothetical protein
VPPAEPQTQTAAPPAPRADDPAGSRVFADQQGQRRAVPRGDRPRGDNPQTGTAVERQGPAPSVRDRDRDRRYDGRNDRRTVYSPRVFNSYYYYPRRYYPYGFGGYPAGYFYYYGSTWYPYPYDVYDYDYRFNPYRYGYAIGELRLDVDPNYAEVWVDGYYAGTVDDFDGFWQSLELEEGRYTIAIVAPGFEPLEFDVRIQAGRKVTYRGDLLTARGRP